MRLTKNEQMWLNGILESYVLLHEIEDGKDYTDEVKAIKGLIKKLVK